MGREIRRVVPDWKHPMQDCHHSPWNGGCAEAKKNNGKCFQPIYDRTFEEAAKEWKESLSACERGERPKYFTEEDRDLEFWEYEGDPPDRKYYRPKWEVEPTWLQVYETVSEGTPVTPPFATEEELINYLVEHGDFWDQHRGDRGWSRENAEEFVKRGWAMSCIVERGPGGMKIMEPRDQ